MERLSCAASKRFGRASPRQWPTEVFRQVAQRMRADKFGRETREKSQIQGKDGERMERRRGEECCRNVVVVVMEMGS